MHTVFVALLYLAEAPHLLYGQCFTSTGMRVTAGLEGTFMCIVEEKVSYRRFSAACFADADEIDCASERLLSCEKELARRSSCHEYGNGR